MITSTANNKIKWIAQLNKKAALRRKEDVFTVEGSKMFLEAPEAYIKEVYAAESFLDSFEKKPEMELIKNKLDQCGYEIVTDEVFTKISDTQTPQGILCVLQQFHYSPADMKEAKEPFLFLVVEGIQDPGNLGTMIRAGEGAGITGVIMNKDTVDIYNPKTIRSTMGSIYRVPFLYTQDLIQAVNEMKSSGIAVYAAHLKGIMNYEECSYKSPTAFLIGNEGNGLTAKLAETADAYIKIPMKGQVESLNAAVASSLLIYEAARQRR